MKYLFKNKKGFTLVELIVTIAVLAILLLIGAPRLIGHVEQAQLTRIQHDVKVMENEIDLAMLEDDVDLADWDTNAKDLSALIVQDKLYDKEGYARSIDKSHLEEHFKNQSKEKEETGQGGMFYALGNIGPNADSNEESDEETLASIIAAGYKIIPEEYKQNINTRLKGTFYTNEEGTVYYEHEKPLTSQKTSFDNICEAPIPTPDYDFDHETGTIIKWHGTEQHLTIPSAFKVGDECYPVRILGERSFMQGQLRKIIIPQSVQRIERQAFYENNLKEVYIPHSVDYIGGGAFEYNYIEEVTIANKIEVVTVSGDAFQNNGPSRNQTVTPTYRQPTNRDLGVIFDTSRGAIVSSSRPSTQDRVLHIPETIIVNEREYVVKTVDKGAYQGLGLISVIMPEGLERIEDYAFSGNHLTGVTIPSTVNYIGNYAFSFNEQVHSETGQIKPTIESVIINGNEQINKIDKHGDIKEHGTKVVLLDNKVTLKDQIFVNSLGNRVVIVNEFVPGATEEQKEAHGETNKPSEPSEPEIDEDGSYVSPALGPEGLVSVVDYETVDPIDSPEGLDSLRQYNDGPISFKGLDSAAFDGNLNTSAEIKTYRPSSSSNRVVTWDGDLTDRMISIKAAGGSYSRMSFVNSNGTLLNYQDANGRTSNFEMFSSNALTRKVKVPKDAVGLKFYHEYTSTSAYDMYIYDISVSDSQRPQINSNTISHTSTTSSITLNWDGRYQKAYIYEGNRFLAEVVGSSYTHTPLYSNSAHTYNVTLVDNNGVGRTAVYRANVDTVGIDFRGIDAAAFDDKLGTSAEIKTYRPSSSSNRVVTWDGDLTDRMISIKAAGGSYSRMSFVNSNGTLLNHQDANGRTSNFESFSSNALTRKVKVPKDAVGLKFYHEYTSTSAYDMYIYDISVEDDERPDINENTISHTSTTSSITLNWDEEFKKAYIYEGSTFLAEITGDSYTHTPLYSNSSHTYNITLLNDSGVGTTATYRANVRTKGIDFRGIDAAAFDDKLGTSAKIKIYRSSSSSNRVVTWTGNLSSKMINIRAGGGSYNRMSFINSNGAHINHEDSNGRTSNFESFRSNPVTRKVKVPEGAVGIKFYHEYNSNSVFDMYIYDINVEY